jgi:hypothetical protein
MRGADSEQSETSTLREIIDLQKTVLAGGVNARVLDSATKVRRLAETALNGPVRPFPDTMREIASLQRTVLAGGVDRRMLDSATKVFKLASAFVPR